MVRRSMARDITFSTPMPIRMSVNRPPPEPQSTPNASSAALRVRSAQAQPSVGRHEVDARCAEAEPDEDARQDRVRGILGTRATADRFTLGRDADDTIRRRDGGRRNNSKVAKDWCPRGDSNSHVLANNRF
jgi:hypothetical protein